MRLLLVEDEERIANFIRRGLSEELYTVDVVCDGGAALEYAQAGHYDV